MHPTLMMDEGLAQEDHDREAIVEALIELFEAGTPQPAPRDIAERAGVSLGVVFAHYDDMDGLCAAVAQRQVQRVWTQLEPLPGASEPLDVRVTALVNQRAQLFEAITPTRRAAMMAAASSPAWLRGLARSEAFLRRQVTEMFTGELAGDPDRVAAVDFAASWEAWDGLRGSSRRSVESASRIMRTMVRSLLTSP